MTHHQALGATDEKNLLDMDSEYPYWAMDLS